MFTVCLVHSLAFDSLRFYDYFLLSILCRRGNNTRVSMHNGYHPLHRHCHRQRGHRHHRHHRRNRCYHNHGNGGCNRHVIMNRHNILYFDTLRCIISARARALKFLPFLFRSHSWYLFKTVSLQRKISTPIVLHLHFSLGRTIVEKSNRFLYYLGITIPRAFTALSFSRTVLLFSFFSYANERFVLYMHS